MSQKLVFCFLVQKNVKQQYEDSLRITMILKKVQRPIVSIAAIYLSRVEESEQNCQPFTAIGEIRKAENPRKAQNTKERKRTYESDLVKLREERRRRMKMQNSTFD